MVIGWSRGRAVGEWRRARREKRSSALVGGLGTPDIGVLKDNEGSGQIRIDLMVRKGLSLQILLPFSRGSRVFIQAVSGHA